MLKYCSHYGVFVRRVRGESIETDHKRERQTERRGTGRIKIERMRKWRWTKKGNADIERGKKESRGRKRGMLISQRVK